MVSHTGQYVGTLEGVELPMAFSRSGRAAWIEFDDDEVPRIRVAQLPARWR